MRKSPASPQSPVPVIRKKWDTPSGPLVHYAAQAGHDIRDVRRRRRIPVAILAERASISPTRWVIPASQSEPTQRFFLRLAWPTGSPISKFPATTRLGVSWKKNICRNVSDGRRAKRPRQQNPRARSNGRGSYRVRGLARHTAPGGTVVDANSSGQGKRHVRV